MGSKHWAWFECSVAVLAIGFLVSSLVMESAGMFGIYCFLLFALFVVELVRVDLKWNEYLDND